MRQTSKDLHHTFDLWKIYTFLAYFKNLPNRLIFGLWKFGRFKSKMSKRNPTKFLHLYDSFLFKTNLPKWYLLQNLLQNKSKSINDCFSSQQRTCTVLCSWENIYIVWVSDEQVKPYF